MNNNTNWVIKLSCSAIALSHRYQTRLENSCLHRRVGHRSRSQVNWSVKSKLASTSPSKRPREYSLLLVRFEEIQRQHEASWTVSIYWMVSVMNDFCHERHERFRSWTVSVRLDEKRKPGTLNSILENGEELCIWECFGFLSRTQNQVQPNKSSEWGEWYIN